jgi:hypothetical protein
MIRKPNWTYTLFQILSVTCDNASNNDTMIQELQHLLDDFPGAANQTRCFAHIINLVVKSILHQFDVPKAKANKALDEASKVLLHIAEDIETEEAKTQANSSDDELADNVEGWIDERDLMDEGEREALAASVMPVRLGLTKINVM